MAHLPSPPTLFPLPTSLIMSDCRRSSSRFSALVSRHRWLRSHTRVPLHGARVGQREGAAQAGLAPGCAAAPAQPLACSTAPNPAQHRLTLLCTTATRPRGRRRPGTAASPARWAAPSAAWAPRRRRRRPPSSSWLQGVQGRGLIRLVRHDTAGRRGAGGSGNGAHGQGPAAGSVRQPTPKDQTTSPHCGPTLFLLLLLLGSTLGPLAALVRRLVLVAAVVGGAVLARWLWRRSPVCCWLLCRAACRLLGLAGRRLHLLAVSRGHGCLLRADTHCFRLRHAYWASRDANWAVCKRPNHLWGGSRRRSGGRSLATAGLRSLVDCARMAQCRRQP